MGDVMHVQGDHQRYPHVAYLRGQVQTSLEIGRIDDIDDQIGVTAGHMLPGNRFIRRRVKGAQRIGAGQVDDLDISIAMVIPAAAFLDRHTRPIADPLARASQRVEQRCLAGVGIAHGHFFP